MCFKTTFAAGCTAFAQILRIDPERVQIRQRKPVFGTVFALPKGTYFSLYSNFPGYSNVLRSERSNPLKKGGSVLILTWDNLLSDKAMPDAAVSARYGESGAWVGKKDRSNT
jgi:hypothetical protein